MQIIHSGLYGRTVHLAANAVNLCRHPLLGIFDFDKLATAGKLAILAVLKINVLEHVIRIYKILHVIHAVAFQRVNTIQKRQHYFKRAHSGTVVGVFHNRHTAVQMPRLPGDFPAFDFKIFAVSVNTVILGIVFIILCQHTCHWLFGIAAVVDDKRFTRVKGINAGRASRLFRAGVRQNHPHAKPRNVHPVNDFFVLALFVLI